MSVIYLDNQATTPLEPNVSRAMKEYIDNNNFANPHSSEHILGLESAQVVESAREKVANYLQCLDSEVIFTSGATESNNTAIIGTALRAKQENSNKTRVLVSAIEHKCILGAGRFVEQHLGMSFETIPVTASGMIDLDKLNDMMGDDVLQVCVMSTNNEMGVNQPISEISDICQSFGSSFHVDAAQSCYVELDPSMDGVTTLSISSHKMYGPKGIGALFINEETETLKPLALMQGGGQENGMRSGTLPAPLIHGFGISSEIMFDKREEEAFKLKQLSDLFIENLKNSGIEFNINGDLDNRHPGNLNIEFVGKDASVILAKIKTQVCASTGSACTSGIQEASHVLSAMGLTTEQCDSSIRFSFGRLNTMQEIEEAISIIENSMN